jgi:hypothetical protein
MNLGQVRHGHATSSSSSGTPLMNFGLYETQPYMALTTLSHATKTSKLQQPYSTSCKTKHLHKTNTTSTSHSLNDSHTHHAAYTTTSKPKHPSSCTVLPKRSNKPHVEPNASLTTSPMPTEDKLELACFLISGRTPASRGQLWSLQSSSLNCKIVSNDIVPWLLLTVLVTVASDCYFDLFCLMTHKIRVGNDAIHASLAIIHVRTRCRDLNAYDYTYISLSLSINPNCSRMKTAIRSFEIRSQASHCHSVSSLRAICWQFASLSLTLHNQTNSIADCESIA